MKIIQVNKYYYLKGGAERYFFELKELLEKQGDKVIPFSVKDKNNLKSEYSSFFLSPIDFSKVRISQGLKVISRMFYSFEAKRKAKELIKKEKPDLVHLHNIYHQISPSILPVFKKYKLPVVMTVHDWKLLCPNYLLFTQGKICERCKKYRYYNAIKYKCVKNSYAASFLSALEMSFHKLIKIYEKNIDLYLVASQFIKDKLVEWNYPAGKIIVLPYFIKQDKLEFQEKKEEKYFLFFGRLSREKGVDILLKAFSKTKTSLKLKIVGSGPEEERLKRLSKELKIEERIEFLGHKEKKELWSLVYNAEFIIIPSLWHEIFGFTALEAMALGKAVLTANNGSLPQLIQKGGLLFNPLDINDLSAKIDWMSENPEEREKMGEEAKKRAREFEPEKHSQRLKEIYESLL